MTLLGLSACNNQAGRSGKPLITDFSIIADEETSSDCTGFISQDLSQCVNECTDEERIATTEEIEAIIKSLKSTAGLSAEDEASLRELVTNSKGVCIEDIKRPDKAVFIKSDYCACQNTTPLILNNCVNFCSGKSTNNEEILFTNVTLDPSIELNEKLGTLNKWCTAEIGDGGVRPSCKLELRDASGTRTLEVKAENVGAKNFTVDIKSLPKDITFVARLVETTSGASSNEFQIRKFTFTPTANPPVGPLKLMASSQYSCITRAGSGTPDGFDFNQALRLHFYFAANKLPPSLPPLETGQLFCHDINTYGLNDSPLFPRFELIPQQFAVWDDHDPRFVDADGNQKEDVNDDLQKRLLDEFGVTRTVKIFGLLKWPNSPGAGSGASAAVPPSIGYFMQPWVNSLTGRGFCPTQEHYNGADPMFRVMKEVVGVDTEGLFLSEREPLVVVGTGGTLVAAPQDVLLIRENLLKRIWFYFENGKHYIPDDITASQKTIMFYWPPDIVNPYIRKSTQYIYTVKAPEDLGSPATGSGLQTSIRPPDKRFGCIPSIGAPNPSDF